MSQQTAIVAGQTTPEPKEKKEGKVINFNTEIKAHVSQMKHLLGYQDNGDTQVWNRRSSEGGLLF